MSSGPRRAIRTAIDRAAARAAPALLTAVVALVGALDVVRLPTGATPVRLGVIVILLTAGLGLSLAMDRPGPRPYWQMALFVTVILMPIVALQASASRVPFVALSRGSAGPLLWLTLATCATLIGFWIFAAHQSDETPQDASLVYLPAALIVPAMLGAPGALGETSALTMLGQSCLVAGAVIFLGLLSPASWRPIAGGVALGAQFVLLWLLGRGPVIGHDGGMVVPLCAALLLTMTVALTVLAPLGALFSRRFVQTVDEEAGGSPIPRVPTRGARRPD